MSDIDALIERLHQKLSQSRQEKDLLLALLGSQCEEGVLDIPANLIPTNGNVIVQPTDDGYMVRIAE
jgi:hypothetical protein